MQIKLDENGNAVLKDGHPIYVKEDGSEMSYDVSGIVKKAEALEEEKTRHWKKAKELETKLQSFEGLDPDAARTALSTVSKLDQKKLIDAGQIDVVTADLQKTFSSERQTWEKERQKMKTDREALEQSKDATIRHLLITTEFNRSPHFTGPSPKTRLPADIASAYFGKHFKVEGEGADAKVVAFIGDRRLLSKSDYSKDANFEEAIDEIIESTYPNKDAILSTGPGSGPQARGSIADKIPPGERTPTQKIAAGLKKQGVSL